MTKRYEGHDVVVVTYDAYGAQSTTYGMDGTRDEILHAVKALVDTMPGRTLVSMSIRGKKAERPRPNLEFWAISGGWGE